MGCKFFQKFNKKKVVIIAVCLTLILAVILWVVWGNLSIKTVEFTVKSDKITDEFDGYNIVHISDFHNAEFSHKNLNLVGKISELNPDIIVITGDTVDSRNTKIDIAVDFIKNLVKIAPCYYVAGNHEARISEYTNLQVQFENLGVVVLKNDFREININGSTITIYGVDDPDFINGTGDQTEIMRQKLDKFTLSSGYNILLSHRPEMLSLYAEFGFDLVFSGHAHGGQFYLPLVGGVVAPHQGLFPKYDKGKFILENTTMILSGGLGNSAFPFRFNNRPEVVSVKLQKQ